MDEVVHELRKTHFNKLREETIEMPRTFKLSKYLYVAMGSILLLSTIFCVPAFSQDNGAQLTEPAIGQNNNIIFSEFLSEVDNGRVVEVQIQGNNICLLYTSPSPRDGLLSRMPSSA